jgi:uncharacterized protein YodC (DUF2158 family)
MAKKIKVFEVGDLVVLRSGGPKMTVVRIKGAEDELVQMVLCAWFAYDVDSVCSRDALEQAFPRKALELADD